MEIFANISTESKVPFSPVSSFFLLFSSVFSHSSQWPDLIFILEIRYFPVDSADISYKKETLLKYTSKEGSTEQTELEFRAISKCIPFRW